MTVTNEDVQTADPWVEPDNRISLSFKIHTGYDSPLINFSGSSAERIKQDIIAVFGQVEVDDLDAITPFELMAKAHEQARAVYLASDVLGATVDAVKKTGNSGGWGGNRGGGTVQQKRELGAESVGKKEKPADPNQAVLNKINEATSKADVFKIFGDHSTGNLKVNGGWPTPELETAAKTKLGELTEKK